MRCALNIHIFAFHSPLDHYNMLMDRWDQCMFNTNNVTVWNHTLIVYVGFVDANKNEHLPKKSAYAPGRVHMGRVNSNEVTNLWCTRRGRAGMF